MPVANASTASAAVAPSHSLAGASTVPAPSFFTDGAITNGAGVAVDVAVGVSVGVDDGVLEGFGIRVGAGVELVFGVAVIANVLGAAVSGVAFGLGVTSI